MGANPPAEKPMLNGLGRYREAIVAAQEASEDTPELFVSVWADSELVEAATRSGRKLSSITASSSVWVAPRLASTRPGCGPCAAATSL